MKDRFLAFLILLLSSSFVAKSVCPFDNFDDVIPFCTEDNEYGITYPAGTSGEGINFFYHDEAYDENGKRVYNNNTGCLGAILSPAWFIMRIEEDGMLKLEISHSEGEDVDFICFGPYDGNSKAEVLNKICDNPRRYLYTSVSYYDYKIDYPEGCSGYSRNRLTVADSIRNYKRILDQIDVHLYECDDNTSSFDERENCNNYWESKREEAMNYISSHESESVQAALDDSTCFRADYDPFPNRYVADCSYSSSPNEICRIDDAKVGEWYLLIITNFSMKAGNIKFNKIAGTATTNCDIIVDASADDVCEGEDLHLNVNNAPTNATFEWSGPNGFTSTLRSPVIHNASKANEGTYSVRMKSYGNVSPYVDVDVIVNRSYSVDTIITIDYGDSYYFGGRKLSVSGEYTHTFESETGCDSVVRLTLSVRVPDVKTTLDNNGPLCEGESLVLSAHNIPNQAKVQWLGPDGFCSEDSVVEIRNVSVRNGGEYRMKVMFGAEVVDVPPTYVDVYATDKIELFESLIDSVFAFNDLILDKPGVYTANLKNTNGCDSVITLHLLWAWDSMSIVPDPYFSPNGDGIKDSWFIDGVDLFPTTVKIYDRFGKVVRVYDTYSNEDGWDGRNSNGQDMPSSDYWFVIVHRMSDKMYFGHVSLIR